MTDQALSSLFREALLAALEETFENVRGMYLDKGTSLFETLATLSAEEASRPVSATCASIAAQVAHVRFYIDVLLRFMRGERPEVDWGEIWRTVREVTPEEWAASQARLREAYAQVRELASRYDDWTAENAIGGALALLMHNAYHLGEIRQALCTIRSQK